MPIQIYSFFSGVGFLDLGFQNAGFEIAFVDEFDERFLQAYQYARRNDPHVPLYGYSHSDVRNFLDDDIWNRTFPDYRQNEDILIGFIGGPPCPDFSTAGKNEGENGANGQLTSVYVNLIIRRQPDFFVRERSCCCRWVLGHLRCFCCETRKIQCLRHEPQRLPCCCHPCPDTFWTEALRRE